MNDIDNSQDTISVEDITDRVDELEGDRGDLEELRETVEDAQRRFNEAQDDSDLSEGEREEIADELAGARMELHTAERWAEENPDDAEELATLAALLNDMQGYGGDHQWRGDWYPGQLIRESYFVEYCQQLLADIGDLPDEIPHYIVIDWDKTADNLRVDYTESEYEGVTYLYR